MPAKHQYIDIEIPKDYGPKEREAIAHDVLEFIRTRTHDKQVDKNGKAFPGYSKDYIKSQDFKIAGKSKGSVNLTLSGDMLAALDLLNHKSGNIRIGFERGSEENARADGNIRGTYGQDSPNRKKARDFLGIKPNELERILERYPTQEEAQKTLDTASGARRISRRGVRG